MRILVVEDEPTLQQQIRADLQGHGYTVDGSGDGKEALYLATEYPYDAAIVDLGLPGLSGLDIIRRLRSKGSRLPILILTARGRWENKVEGLEAGADDYLTKPFQPEELLARVKALLRRAGLENSAPLAAGRVQLDTQEHTVQIGTKEPVRLTKLELRLLQMLVANAGHTVSSDRLLMQVWGHKGSGDRQLLKQLVHRLRQKIEVDAAAPQMLQTVVGAGYKLIVD